MGLSTGLVLFYGCTQDLLRTESVTPSHETTQSNLAEPPLPIALRDDEFALALALLRTLRCRRPLQRLHLRTPLPRLHFRARLRPTLPRSSPIAPFLPKERVCFRKSPTLCTAQGTAATEALRRAEGTSTKVCT